MHLDLVVRDLQPIDLDALAWSGGDVHLQVVEESMQRSWRGEVELVVCELPNGRLVGLGGVDWTRRPGAGWLWMLAVDDAWQGLGLGTMVIAELERRCLGRGCTTACLTVELDNPRAAELYRRLGYRDEQQVTETWPGEDGNPVIAACTLMVHELSTSSPGSAGE